MREIKNGLLMLLVVAVAGCANTGGYNNAPVEEDGSQQGAIFDQPDYSAQTSPDQSYPEPDETYQKRAPDYNVAPTSPGNNSAVISLLGAADKQRQSGDYMRAAATLERAIRISPRDPELYYQLAQVRYLQRNYHQTEQLCRKAISLAAGNKKVLTNCRELMARVATATG